MNDGRWPLLESKNKETALFFIFLLVQLYVIASRYIAEAFPPLQYIPNQKYIYTGDLEV